jgi:hypothetical protein
MRLFDALVGWKGYAVVAAACLLLGAGGGYKIRDVMAQADSAKAAKAEVRTVEHVVYRERAAADVTQRIGEQAATRQAEIRYVTRTLVEKVPVYVTAEADRTCVLPVGFVRLHDEAAATPGEGDAIPEPAGGAYDQPAGVACSAAAETIVANYGDYHAVAAQLTALQTWIREQQTLSTEPVE